MIQFNYAVGEAVTSDAFDGVGVVQSSFLDAGRIILFVKTATLSLVRADASQCVRWVPPPELLIREPAKLEVEVREEVVDRTVPPAPAPAPAPAPVQSSDVALARQDKRRHKRVW